jgi:hypothetical protein
MYAPSWIFENLNVADYSPLGSEVVHQISQRSVKRFKSYRDTKIAAKLQDGVINPEV